MRGGRVAAFGPDRTYFFYNQHWVAGVKVGRLAIRPARLFASEEQCGEEDRCGFLTLD